MRQKTSRLLTVIALLILAAGFTSADAGSDTPRSNALKDQVITQAERVLGLATIYANVKQHSAYLDRLTESGWDKAFIEYVPQVEKEQSLYDYYRVLQRFIALIQDGHTNVNFPPAVYHNLDGIPILLDVSEGKWAVVQRFPTDDVLREDIPIGSILESIEGLPPSKYFAEKFYPYIAAGNEQAKRRALDWMAQYPKNTKVNLLLRYPDGSLHDRVVKANRSTVQWTDDLMADYMPPWQRGGGFSSSELEPGIEYLSFRRCDQKSEGQLVSFLESWSSKWPKGVILDLRDNPGGSTPTNCVSHLISKPIHWPYQACRWSISYINAYLQHCKSDDDLQALLKEYGLPEKFSPEWYMMSASTDVISPAEIHYNGPLVILIGPRTGSAAEDLVVLLKQAGRGTFLGSPTGGSTGQPFSFNLPGGGSGRVCTVKTRYTSGKEFIGVGCEPEISIVPTIKGIADGRDEVLDAALDYLHKVAQ